VYLSIKGFYMSTVKEGRIVLDMQHISKQFPNVLANEDVSIQLREGEIISLLGENGAGKSTLMNVLYGLYKPSAGKILLNGKEVEISSPKDAIALGLGMVHQHFMLVDTLSVTENIILGSEPGKAGVIDYKTARKEVSELSEKYHLEVDPDAIIENMAVGLQQRVEILKALYRKAKILILDEPTAVLTPHEVDQLFEVIRKLRESGVSMIIITHKLEEVKAISDRVYILRRGKCEGERDTKDITKEDMANLMVGREVILTVHKEKKEVSGDPIFSLSDITVKNEKGINALDGLSLNVRPGEIVGIAGVDGNGQTELSEAIMGMCKLEDGKIVYKGERLGKYSTRQRRNRKISNVPADRHRFGLILPMNVSENMVLGFHDEKPYVRGINLALNVINDYSEKLVHDFDIRTPGVNVPAGNLSGGNQQKVILAREFSRDPDFLLVAQPTRGLDVGAIEYIHSQILKMRDRNVGILLISLELEEVFSLSDRILVLYEGKIVKEFVPEETTDKEVGFYMTGGKKE
jgi:general nucleoside transport system ATP-binding protein